MLREASRAEIHMGEEEEEEGTTTQAGETRAERGRTGKHMAHYVELISNSR